MKVFIPHTDSDINSLNGKSLFCYRLGNELRAQGVEVVCDPNKTVEISLNVIRLTHTKSKIKVLRLNGVYHNSGQDYEKKNANIKRSLQACDAVVYQSNHSCLLCNAFIGHASVPCTVISNGADPAYWKQFKTTNPIPNHKIVLAVSKWRPHKRLRDIVGSFLMAELEGTSLVVIGDISRSGLNEYEKSFYRAHPQLVFTGNINQQQLAYYIKQASLAIHLCWFDACPNSVVELLCAGVPVISNNVGGTPELLGLCKLDKLVCRIDEPYNYEPVDLYNPPYIDRQIVADTINDVIQYGVSVDSTQLHIQNIATQYKMFFEELLNGLS